MASINKIIVSQENLENPIQLINDLTWFVNIKHPNQKLYNNPNVHPDLAMAYTLSFYATQITSAGFFKAVYDLEKAAVNNKQIQNGLERIAAEEQLIIFKERTVLVTSLSYVDLELYFNKNIGQDTPYPILEDDISEKVSKQVTQILGKWISKHPDLKIISDKAYRLLLKEK